MADRGVKSGLAALMLLGLAMFFVVAGCGKLDKKGPTPPNFAPEAYLANVPVDSASFLANPTVHWYATDRDGYVTMYRYSVQKVEDHPDPEVFIEQSRQNGWEDWIDVPVATGEVSTSGQIRLFAAAEPDSFVDQFVFVMAVDNFGAESNVPYRMFSRANHAPGTEVFLSRGPFITGSCRASQAQNIGIPVQWEGSDTLDYPGKQPDFEYAWEVYGPFDSRIDTAINEKDTTFTVIPDTIGIDWKDRLIDQSFSDFTNSKWTFDQFATLYNLFGDVAQDGVTLFGAFVFQVRTRDDAFVEDPTPATMTFQALKPACERDVMILDVTAYQDGAAGRGGLCNSCGEGNLRENRYNKYYEELFSEAGGFSFADSSSLLHYAFNGDASLIPPLQTFGRYSLVVLFAEDFWNSRKDPWRNALATYLDMGGNVMVLGNNLLASTYESVPGEVKFPLTFMYSSSSMQYRYFNVAGVYDPVWWESWYRALLTGFELNSNEEMVRALSLVPSLPDLVPDFCDTINDELLAADTCHMSEYVVGTGMPGATFNVWEVDPETGQHIQPYPYYKGALPGVNYFISGGLAEGLYMARSAYGTFGSIDGGLVGYRYQTEGFKTSVFGFPLYAFPRWQAVQFLTEMIDWYDLESL